MGVHGSQGICSSPPAPSPVAAAGSSGTGGDWPWEGREERMKSPPDEHSCVAAGRPPPGEQGPALRSQVYSRLMVHDLGRGPSPVLASVSPSVNGATAEATWTLRLVARHPRSRFLLLSHFMLFASWLDHLAPLKSLLGFRFPPALLAAPQKSALEIHLMKQKRTSYPKRKMHLFDSQPQVEAQPRVGANK